jgi:GTP:adenosylcobinamide-phosphate guanylyltransferase
MRGFKGFERGLIPIAGKPMIQYVLEVIPDEVSNIFIAVDDEKKVEAYRSLAEEYWAKIIFSNNLSGSIRSQIEFALSSIENESVLILPCDSPLLTRDFTTFLG